MSDELPTKPPAKLPTKVGSCEAPAQCATPAEVNAAADALCRRARAAESRIGEYRDHAEMQEQAVALCHGRRQQLEAEHAERPAHALPSWVWPVVGLAGMASGGATGWCVGQCPDYLAGAAVASVVGVVIVGVGLLFLE